MSAREETDAERYERHDRERAVLANKAPDSLRHHILSALAGCHLLDNGGETPERVMLKVGGAMARAIGIAYYYDRTMGCGAEGGGMSLTTGFGAEDVTLCCAALGHWLESGAELLAQIDLADEIAERRSPERERQAAE